MTNTLRNTLKHFTGSDTFYPHTLYRKFVYTEGVQYLAEEAGAYWLIDYIFSNQHEAKLKQEGFQVWELVKDDNGATITVEDGNKNIVKRFEILFTDFPLQEFTLWFVGGTLLLPSEY